MKYKYLDKEDVAALGRLLADGYGKAIYNFGKEVSHVTIKECGKGETKGIIVGSVAVIAGFSYFMYRKSKSKEKEL